MLNLRKFIFSGLLLFALILGGLFPLSAQEKPSTHLVILSDPHLPGRNLSLKQKTIETINAWPDADGVVVLGDICQEVGTAEEYDAAKKFFGKTVTLRFRVTTNASLLTAFYVDDVSLQ